MGKRIALTMLVMAVGCGGSEPTPLSIPDAPGKIGHQCSGDGECDGALCIGGSCGDLCKSHADCGCALGTKDADIAAGSCGAACVYLGSGLAGCFRVCEIPEVDAIACDYSKDTCATAASGDYRVCM